VRFFLIELLHTLGSFQKITEVGQMLKVMYVKSYGLVLTKNGAGYILGDFFTNSSGHPGKD
jgi:hypothetical protein